MKVTGNEIEARENAFHHKTDESVTVDDLWESWFQSSAREWTTYDLINWINNVVRLPQYANNLLDAKCSGISLPRHVFGSEKFVTTFF